MFIAWLKRITAMRHSTKSESCVTREKSERGNPAALVSRENRAALRRRLMGGSRLVHLLDVFPVHQMIEERFDVIRPAVAVVDVVGMLPHVATQNRFGPVHERVLAVGGLHHGDLAVL